VLFSFKTILFALSTLPKTALVTIDEKDHHKDIEYDKKILLNSIGAGGGENFEALEVLMRQVRKLAVLGILGEGFKS